MHLSNRYPLINPLILVASYASRTLGDMLIRQFSTPSSFGQAPRHVSRAGEREIAFRAKRLIETHSRNRRHTTHLESLRILSAQ